ncbi:TetR/AcrR family transcriptional regulator [Pyruvatibacter sp.]|uniref:TetR/AcrR family transcriptional regulator n=1 Tax=Pyruvatibacter sp. TaxID=1981328 RepID=UPI003267012D
MASRMDRAQAVVAIGELFREHGYHGTSYGQITAATGLGKGSLYNHFPNGKEDMTRAVLAHVHGWFEDNVFGVLASKADPMEAVDQMFVQVDDYFRSGRRLCLLGAFSLYDVRTAFDAEIVSYFSRWVETLAGCLKRGGLSAKESKVQAMACMVDIQGGLLMAHAFDDAAIFTSSLARSAKTLRAAMGDRVPA